VKDDREERGTRRKSQAGGSTPTIQASASQMDDRRKRGEKKKRKPGNQSHSVTAGQRKEAA
jgi:hypothetical protein